MHSAICTGWVRHRRYKPVAHGFRYRTFMMYLDLDELPQIFARSWLWSSNRRNLAWFRRADYLGNPSRALKDEVAALVKRETDMSLNGPIRMLTNLRYFGYCFNPVTFYYCFEADGSTLRAIVADITNTPWNERRAYVLDCTQPCRSGTHRFRFSKDFHISPFMPMAMLYDWRFGNPQNSIGVHMRNLADESCLFDATLKLTKQPITGLSLLRVLLAYPFMTFKVILAIYCQAFRLWFKGATFYPHSAPASRDIRQPAQGNRP